MKHVTVRFLNDYQGKHTPGHRYTAGQVLAIELPACQRLAEEGVIELVEQPEQPTEQPKAVSKARKNK